jgi:hypothetical protein
MTRLPRGENRFVDGMLVTFLFGLAGVVGGLSFAAGFLRLAFSFQIGVADSPTGHFLGFAFGFFDTTLSLILVHGVLLKMK